jgi:hypothetical protein
MGRHEEDAMSEIKPALTPEEWHALNSGEAFVNTGQRGPNVLFVEDAAEQSNADGCYYVRKPHAMAALALHGQPFGFTHEDVAQIREAADYVRDREDNDRDPLLGELYALADRIAALLPPEPMTVTDFMGTREVR